MVRNTIEHEDARKVAVVARKCFRACRQGSSR